MAHGEGRFLAQRWRYCEALNGSNLIALSYVGEGYPANPNGSVANIAGICNEQGNVLGLMPHPENHIFTGNTPAVTVANAASGLGLFVTV